MCDRVGVECVYARQVSQAQPKQTIKTHREILAREKAAENTIIIIAPIVISNRQSTTTTTDNMRKVILIGAVLIYVQTIYGQGKSHTHYTHSPNDLLLFDPFVVVGIRRIEICGKKQNKPQFEVSNFAPSTLHWEN